MPPSVYTYEKGALPNDTEEVTLRFPGVRVIWKFIRDTNTLSYLMNARDKTLTCRCSEAEIELAYNQYRAELVKHKDSVTAG